LVLALALAAESGLVRVLALVLALASVLAPALAGELSRWERVVARVAWPGVFWARRPGGR